MMRTRWRRGAQEPHASKRRNVLCAALRRRLTAAVSQINAVFMVIWNRQSCLLLQRGKAQARYAKQSYSVSIIVVWCVEGANTAAQGLRSGGRGGSGVHKGVGWVSGGNQPLRFLSLSAGQPGPQSFCSIVKRTSWTETHTKKRNEKEL